MNDLKAKRDLTLVAWDPWTTLGLFVILVFAFLAVDVLVLILFLIVTSVQDPSVGVDAVMREAEFNGVFFSTATLATSMVCTGLTFLFVKMKKGISVKMYLALHKIPWKSFTLWAFLLLIYLFLTDWITTWLGFPLIPEFMEKIYTSAKPLPLLWLALLLGAPVMEEIVFRGFLFHSIAATRLGVVGAILTPALFWAIIHTQYDLFYVIVIFFGGVLFGLARHYTGSVLSTILLHSLWNLVSTITTHWHVKG